MNFNIYLIPPVISLIVGLGLALLFLVKGKFKKDNVLFALICIWWSLLSPIFISHHLFHGNIELILKIERSIHFFYVFIPVVNLVHFYNYYDLKRRYIIWICLVLSSIFAITTQTPYYISGLYTYSWGYMAKGGIAFQLFGLYGTIIVVYFIVLFFRMLKTETNKIRRTRLKYILASFNTVALLTMGNLPALNGIDVYPMGNFMFIPLLFLAYSIFRYRFMDIETIVSTTLIWAVISSLILIPNIVIFLVLWPYIVPEPRFEQFPVLVTWFLANYFYLRYVQPKIDQLFNRRKYNLRSAAAAFIENISLLHTLDALINEFIELVKKAF
jgi:hypothetical protein